LQSIASCSKPSGATETTFYCTA